MSTELEILVKGMYAAARKHAPSVSDEERKVIIERNLQYIQNGILAQTELLSLKRNVVDVTGFGVLLSLFQDRKELESYVYTDLFGLSEAGFIKEAKRVFSLRSKEAITATLKDHPESNKLDIEFEDLAQRVLDIVVQPELFTNAFIVGKEGQGYGIDLTRQNEVKVNSKYRQARGVPSFEVLQKRFLKMVHEKTKPLSDALLYLPLDERDRFLRYEKGGDLKGRMELTHQLYMQSGLPIHPKLIYNHQLLILAHLNNLDRYPGAEEMLYNLSHVQSQNKNSTGAFDPVRWDSDDDQKQIAELNQRIATDLVPELVRISVSSTGDLEKKLEQANDKIKQNEARKDYKQDYDQLKGEMEVLKKKYDALVEERASTDKENTKTVSTLERKLSDLKDQQTTLTESYDERIIKLEEEIIGLYKQMLKMDEDVTYSVFYALGESGEFTDSDKAKQVYSLQGSDIELLRPDLSTLLEGYTVPSKRLFFKKTTKEQMVRALDPKTAVADEPTPLYVLFSYNEGEVYVIGHFQEQGYQKIIGKDNGIAAKELWQLSDMEMSSRVAQYLQV